jgi:hypothetical protein
MNGPGEAPGLSFGRPSYSTRLLTEQETLANARVTTNSHGLHSSPTHWPGYICKLRSTTPFVG